MNYRILTIDDCYEFRRLKLIGLKEAPFAFSATYDEEACLPIEAFQKLLLPKKNNFVVGAFKGENLVCIARIHDSIIDESAETVMLSSMYCDAAYRASGVSKGVIQYTLEYLKLNSSVKILHLLVYSDNTPAIEFYKTCGFKVDHSYNDQHCSSRCKVKEILMNRALKD